MTMVVAGCICLVGGLVLIAFGGSAGLLLGIIPALMGGIWALSKKGLEIDLEQKQIRVFVSFLGFNIGKWESLADYSFTTIIRKTMREDFDEEVDSAYRRFDYVLCFLSWDHLKKREVFSHEGLEKVTDVQKEISAALNFPMVSFSPKTTRMRRRTRC